MTKQDAIIHWIIFGEKCEVTISAKTNEFLRMELDDAHVDA